MKLRKGTKITVKSPVESYESREVSPKILPQYVDTYLNPGDVATVVRANVPYVSSRGSFVFVRFEKDGLKLRTGIDPKNIRVLKGSK